MSFRDKKIIATQETVLLLYYCKCSSTNELYIAMTQRYVHFSVLELKVSGFSF